MICQNNSIFANLPPEALDAEKLSLKATACLAYPKSAIILAPVCNSICMNLRECEALIGQKSLFSNIIPL